MIVSWTEVFFVKTIVIIRSISFKITKQSLPFIQTIALTEFQQDLGPDLEEWSLTKQTNARGMRCLAAIDCVEQESDKSANFIDKCEKTDRTEPWNLKLFQLNKISCFGESQQTNLQPIDIHNQYVLDK